MLSKRRSSAICTPEKRMRGDDSPSYLFTCLEKSGLTLKDPPCKHIANQESVRILQALKKNIKQHCNYPENVLQFFSCFEEECEDLEIFRHFLYPNIVRTVEDSLDDHEISESVVRILLQVPVLQEKLITYLFNKMVDFAVECDCGPWIKMTLKCFMALDNLNMTLVSRNLINLLEVTSELVVRLDILMAIPEILGDQEHQNIALEMSRFLSEEHELIPAVLDCLSYLTLSDDQYANLQRKTLNILMTLTKYSYFPNFIKFLLMPGRMSEAGYLEIVQGLRNALDWPLVNSNIQEIATSQVVTATALRTSMISSKTIALAWMKELSSCKISTDHRPFDFIILLLMYTISEEKQKTVEKFIRKQIKMDVLKKDLVSESFEKYKPILKDNISHLIQLTNSLLVTQMDPLVEAFTSNIYILMFTNLKDCRRHIIAQLLQLGLDRKHCIKSILHILNEIGAKDMSMLKPQSMQMLMLLDRMDDLNLGQKRDIMNLVCGLAFSFQNSIIRDDVFMIIRKELGSSNPTVKIQGILAGVYAVKFLMKSCDVTSAAESSTDISSSLNLPEGDIREAAEIIELIGRNTKQFSDLTIFYYDELCNVIASASGINNHFLTWITEAVTDDLKNHFIVDTVAIENIGELKLSMQYCLNAEEDIDEAIAINIAGLTLEPKDEIDIAILPSLFQLVQTLHNKQNDGNLSSIDALLGCPVIMTKFDLDLINEVELETVHSVLDCLIHCVNWFRELLNGFAAQTDTLLKTIMFNRILQIEELETMITQILLKTSGAYKPPKCNFDMKKYLRDGTGKKSHIQLHKAKMSIDDDTILPETLKSQSVNNNNSLLKTKADIMPILSLRSLGLNLVQLFNNDLCMDNTTELKLDIKAFKFLLKCVNDNLENRLIAKIKRKTFLSKPESSIYDHAKAETCAKNIDDVLPKLISHMNDICKHLEKHRDDIEGKGVVSTELYNYLSCLEYLYTLFGIYFRWIGFKNHNNALLKTSLRSFITDKSNKSLQLKDLFLSVANILRYHVKYCFQITTATSLFDLLKAIEDLSGDIAIHKILKNVALNFLTQQWKTIDGVLEKGLNFNQSIEKITVEYFMNIEIAELKLQTEGLRGEVRNLKGRFDPLTSFVCFNKSNFPILYRNIGRAIHGAAKKKINKGIKNSDQLAMWMDVVIILNDMIEIAKIIDNRNNLSAIFKKSLPILTLFMTHGISVVKVLFKSHNNEILLMFKNLQKTTRFLQSLCCHSRLKKDTALMAKVPVMKQTLENLIYKVKAILAAHNCSEAFWIGNLKNKNIHGEVINSQRSVDEESTEDTNDQLPEDDDGADQIPDEDLVDTDDEVINSDSKSISDII